MSIVSRSAGINAALFRSCYRGPAHRVLSATVLECVKLFGKKSGMPDFKYIAQVALHKAIRAGCLPTVQTLIRIGAPINAQNTFDTDHNDYSIVRAAYQGPECNPISFALIDAGANLSAACEHGHTPLLVATPRHNTELVEYLLHAGANPNQSDKEGLTPLMEAASSGHYRAITLLLNKKADAKAVDLNGKTALMKLRDPLLESKHEEFIKAANRLSEQSDLKAADDLGNTALHHALLYPYRDTGMLASLLVNKGACRDTMNEDKETPRSLAQIKKWQDQKRAEKYERALKQINSKDFQEKRLDEETILSIFKEKKDFKKHFDQFEKSTVNYLAWKAISKEDPSAILMLASYWNKTEIVSRVAAAQQAALERIANYSEVCK